MSIYVVASLSLMRVWLEPIVVATAVQLVLLAFYKVQVQCIPISKFIRC